MATAAHVTRRYLQPATWHNECIFFADTLSHREKKHPLLHVTTLQKKSLSKLSWRLLHLTL